MSALLLERTYRVTNATSASANSGHQSSPVQRGRYGLDQTGPVWRAR